MCAARTFPVSVSSTDAPVELVHADAWIVIAYKPVGMPVQADRTGDGCLLDTVRTTTGRHGLELVNRIDRPVSGLVLLAERGEALSLLNDQFRERAVEKSYWAIVEGKVDGVGPVLLEHSLIQDGITHKAVVKELPSAVRARLNVAVIARGERYTLLQVVPEGGAFHQIRAQLAAWGHPIKGDVKYGARRGEKDRSIALHAQALRFLHPITAKELHIRSEPPRGQSLWRALLDGKDQTGSTSVIS